MSIVSDLSNSKQSELSLLLAATNFGGYFLTLAFQKNAENGEIEMMVFTRAEKILDGHSVQISNMIVYEGLSFILFSKNGQVLSIYGGE